MWGRSAPNLEKMFCFFLAFAGKEAAAVGREWGWGREMGCETGVICCWLWISSFSLVTQVEISNCSTSSILVTCYPDFSPLQPSSFAPYHGALYFPHMTGLATLLDVTLNGNAILSHFFCHSGCSAFREKDLLLSWPIYTDAAVNLNVLCPCVIPSTGGQEFIAKKAQKSNIWPEPARQNSPSIQTLNSALQQ